MIIKKLDADVIAKVAASEFIENPFSVVKELLDNSIDAGAKNIVIELENFGLNKIKVIDDGRGMDKQNLLQCFLRHTTSKITNYEDLLNHDLLGFRGEGLFSIASIANVFIKSRFVNLHEGYFVNVADNVLLDQGVVGMPVGTQVEVLNLFFNIPARRKYLIQSINNISEVIELLYKYSLVNCDVGFKLIHNSKPILTLNNSAQKNKILEVLNVTSPENILNFNFEEDFFKVEAYITKPQFCNFYKQKNFVYINNRILFIHNFNSLIKKALSTYIDPKLHPGFVLFINVPSHFLDINVHPQKQKISILKNDVLEQSLIKNLLQVLQQYNSAYSAGYMYEQQLKPAYLDYSNILRDNDNYWLLKDSSLDEDQDIMQINNLYLIAKSNDGFILFDQHAAHEKILYNEFSENFKNSVKNNIVTLEPAKVLHLPVKDFNLLMSNQEFFNNLGFEFELFGDTSLKINKLPSLFINLDLNLLFSEILLDISKVQSFSKIQQGYIDTQTHKILAFLACRTAIKGGEYLNINERKKLVTKVLQDKNTYTCPHGRPAYIKFCGKDLDKLFKRIK